MFDPASTVVIANPAAAGGRVGRQRQALSQQLQQALGPVQLLKTGSQGHGRELAAQAVRDGTTELLSLGGDGSHNEVVNGIMDAEPDPGAITLGIPPAGTGGDFRRNLAHAATLAALPQAPCTASTWVAATTSTTTVSPAPAGSSTWPPVACRAWSVARSTPPASAWAAS